MKKPMKKIKTLKKDNKSKKKPKNKAVSSSKKTAKKPIKKTAKKTAKKPIKKTAKKTAKKPIKKTAKKPIKKTAKKPIIKKEIKDAKPLSKMSPEERKQLAQKKLPKRKKPTKYQENKIKEERRDILKNPTARQYLIDLAGEHALALVQEFTYNMSDDDLSRKLKVKVSEVRSTLNKMHNKGLVTYSRSKDTETGWYSYIWEFRTNKISELVTQMSQKEKAREEIAEELYFCSHCKGDLVKFSEAMDLKFKCPICSTSLTFKERE